MNVQIYLTEPSDILQYLVSNPTHRVTLMSTVLDDSFLIENEIVANMVETRRTSVSRLMDGTTVVNNIVTTVQILEPKAIANKSEGAVDDEPQDDSID